MDLAATIAGAVIVVVGLRDMFQSLLHPRGKGALSHGVLSGIWRLSRSSGHRFGNAVGTAGMMAVVVLWVVLLGLGGALIYAPHVTPTQQTIPAAAGPDPPPAAGHSWCHSIREGSHL